MLLQGPIQIAMAIVLAVFFCILVAFNWYSLRSFSQAGGKTKAAIMVIKIINIALLLGALSVVAWAIFRR